jgi:hypothetical protein
LLHHRAWDFAAAEDKPEDLEALRFKKVTGADKVAAAEEAWAAYTDNDSSGTVVVQAAACMCLVWPTRGSSQRGMG